MGRTSPKPPPDPRRLEELVDALRRHVRVLRFYADLAFTKRQEDFLGEVAGKLRLLVADPTITPLLLGLKKELNIEVPLPRPPTIRPLNVRHEPVVGDTMTLEEVLASQAYGTLTSSDPMAEGYLLRLGMEGLLPARADLIRKWAQQLGSSHEAWWIDAEFAAFRDAAVFSGQSPLAPELLIITKTVLHVADEVLAQATPERIAKAEMGRLRPSYRGPATSS